MEDGIVTSIYINHINSHQSNLATWFLSTALDPACAVVTPMAMLTFSLECRGTLPGQAVFIVGSVAELGTWKIPLGAPFSSLLRTTQWTVSHCYHCYVLYAWIVMDGELGCVICVC